MADEAAYITLLVASERVASWLHDVQHYAGTARCDLEASSAPPATNIHHNQIAGVKMPCYSLPRRCRNAKHTQKRYVYAHALGLY